MKSYAMYIHKYVNVVQIDLCTLVAVCMYIRMLGIFQCEVNVFEMHMYTCVAVLGKC